MAGFSGTGFRGHGISCVRGERVVFTGLSFRIEPGGALVLVGPNGSGKSSLLRVMAGLARPDSGALEWNGAAISAQKDAHRARVHYVGHADAVKPALSVLENVHFWATLLSDRGTGSGASSRRRAERALDALGIGHLADVPGRFLSAGQRRRVSLARIIAAPAPLWLLDEPRTALDADATGRLDGLIAEHRGGGGIVVMSLHAGEKPERAAILDLAAFSAFEALADGSVSPC
jgi:heme exporter protein A